MMLVLSGIAKKTSSWLKLQHGLLLQSITHSLAISSSISKSLYGYIMNPMWRESSGVLKRIP